MRDTISVIGARENNLKNVSVEIPRNKLIVVTGLSGSGKSSLAFDTIFAEGQRRFFESLDAFVKKFASQLKKPEVDFVHGLSPVISIEQKSVNKNPRSTVGTMTDIQDFLRLLFATIGEAHCPYCQERIPTRTPYLMVEHLMSLPAGTLIEIGAPVFKIYGEDYKYLLGDIRNKGYRRLRVNDELLDIGDDTDLDETQTYDLQVVIDKFVIKRDIEKNVLAALEQALRVGEGFVTFRVLTPGGVDIDAFYRDFACAEHHIVMGQAHPSYFGFNEGSGPCVTCGGLGTYLKVHPDLLVPDKTRSINGGAFIPEAFRNDPNVWNGYVMYSLSRHFGFSLDTPFGELAKEVVDVLFYGTKGQRFEILQPPNAKQQKGYVGHTFRFDGIINEIERRYKHYRRKQVSYTEMEQYLRRVMVENDCPDCGGRKLKQQRMLVKVSGQTIFDLGNMPFAELRSFLKEIPIPERHREAGEEIRREITSRLGLLVDIGVDYLNLNRRSMTLSGGESQRIRLSTQISSGLMGMMYVLDEPSIGLHPKDNQKLIATLKRLRDIGNTVIVVEHDEETIRAADFIVEIGPGPGQHGGEVVATGTVEDIIRCPASLTGQYFSGKRKVSVPKSRRSPSDRFLTIVGARHHNLRDLTVQIPLGVMTCVTGASGSGKSTLVNEILYKRLVSLLHDSRVLSGKHERLEGVELIGDVVNIDQTPIGRTPRSNPATYIGFYDDIRYLFSTQKEAVARGYGRSRFSFNLKGGRCEECAGEGQIVTELHFMPDIESVCPVCKGARYNEETLEITYRGKNIAEVLDLTIEDAVCFFTDQRRIAHKLRTMHELGLGYLKLGQSSTTLSGGEAQRIKLALELGKIKPSRRGNLYILDEPTTGLHLADIQRLLDSLNRLVDAGHTVLVIEHHLDVIKTADWILDLGPEGGRAGGQLVVQGTPEDVAACGMSHTGRFLKGLLKDGEAG